MEEGEDVPGLAVKDEIEVPTINGTCKIQLSYGSVTKLSKDEEVDVLVISAFPGNYVETPWSVIGALRRELGISVAELAEDKEEDLRRIFSCWWSKELPQNANFRRILCFEGSYKTGARPPTVIGEIFRCLVSLSKKHPIKVMMPLLATGHQGYDYKMILTLLVEVAIHWMEIGLLLEVLKIVIYQKDLKQVKDDPMIKVFSTLKRKWLKEQAGRKKMTLVHPLHYDIYLSYCPHDKVVAEKVINELRKLNKNAVIYSERQEVDPEKTWQDHIYTVCRNKYICKPPNGSVITDITKIMHKAAQRRRRVTRAPECRRVDDLGWLDYARMRYGGPYLDGQVDTLLALLRLLPILACMIIYWTVYLQIQTSFLLQGLAMDPRITDSFNIPAATLGIFDILVILLLIPIADRFIYPGLRKLKIEITPLRRMGFGMILAFASLISAAVVEVHRRDKYSGRIVTISGKKYKQSDMTIFYQIPQFLLVGMSEVFTVISGLEFSYAQSPRVMQGVVMGIFLINTGLGSFLGSALIQLTNIVSYKVERVYWFNGNDINSGKLDYFFYLLAILLGINFLVFCAIAARYTYVSSATLQKDEEDWERRANSRPIPCIDNCIDSDEYLEKD